jgi:hypothetical protein
MKYDQEKYVWIYDESSMGIRDVLRNKFMYDKYVLRGKLNQWESKVYFQVKEYGNSTSLPWDPILQGIVKCKFMALNATRKVLTRVQEDDVYM